MFKFLTIVISVPKSFYFCLRCLPFRQAIKLPIFIKYNTKVTINGGRVEFQSESINTAMVRIGFHEVPTKDAQRAVLNIKGRLIFLGEAHIGAGSILHVQKNGILQLGDNFSISACSTINCYKQISFGRDIQFSWDCLVMDCDTHAIYDEGCRNVINESKEIILDNHILIGCGVTILKGTHIPSECVVAAHSVVTAKGYEHYSIIAGNPAKSVKKIGGWKL